MRFVDLFAGLGGFHLAAERHGGICVLASELDPDLQTLYEANFGIKPKGDIRTVPLQDIPAHDLLCAGFPCQPFSKAGSQKGWKDAIRGTLFDHIVNILERRKPEFVVLENVAHFIRHDEGNTYQKVQEALSAIGYTVESHVLSPHSFGIPQIRERMYLVGRLGSLTGFTWPKPTSDGNGLRLKNYLDKAPADAVPITEQTRSCIETWQEFLDRVPRTENISGFPVWSMEFGATYPFTKYDSLHEAPLPTLRRSKGSFGATLNMWFREDLLARVPSHARWDDDCFPVWKQNFIRKNRALYRKHKARLSEWLPRIKRFPSSLQKLEWHGDGRNIWDHVIQFRASGVRVKRPTTAPALVAMTTSQIPIIGWEKRYMTIRECARLQSMEGLKRLPDRSVAVRAFGNAVNVDVASLVIKSLLGLRGRPTQTAAVAPKASRQPVCA